MRQLRQGIKLKKVTYDRTPREFALTPYEILMDDIRSCKYQLKPIDVHPKKVEKDARDRILEFIRSRPPLKPAGERRLKARVRKESTARELILENIRDPAGGRQNLKKTDRRPSRNNVLEEMKRKRRHGVIGDESPVKADPRPSTLDLTSVLVPRRERLISRTTLSLLSLTVKARLYCIVYYFYFYHTNSNSQTLHST